MDKALDEIMRERMSRPAFTRHLVPLTATDPHEIFDGLMYSTEPGGGPMGTFPAPAGFRWENDDEFRARIKRTMEEISDG